MNVATVNAFCYHDRRSLELRIRRLLLILAALAILLLPSFAADGVWWDGMVMTDFTYKGLQNVPERTVNSLLRPYMGKEFSDSVFAEMNAVLYAQPWLSYVSAEALQDESGALYIQFDITENPMISSVSASGNRRVKQRTILNHQDISSGDFFTPGMSWLRVPWTAEWSEMAIA